MQKRIALYNITEANAKELVWRYFSEPDLEVGLIKQLEFYDHYKTHVNNSFSELLWVYMCSCFGNTTVCPYSGLDSDPFIGAIDGLHDTDIIVQVGNTSLVFAPVVEPVIDSGCINYDSAIMALGIGNSWEATRTYKERFNNALKALLLEVYGMFGFNKIRVLEDRYVLILYSSGLGLLTTTVN